MRESAGSSLLRRKAGEIKNYRIFQRILPIVLTCLAITITLVYVVSVMYTKFGSFTVTVNKYHQLQYGLSLSETRNFAKPTGRLNCRASEEITNIDGAWLDEYDIGAVDGVDSGDNYLCYTFYCKNAGKETLSYDYSIDITNMTMDLEKAVRVRLITSRGENPSTTVDYARANGVDEFGNAIPEPNTTPFYNKTTVMLETMKDVVPEEIIKYTVVIWLEGNDPDCTDDKIGGEFKVDMKFSVVAAAGEAV